MTKAIVTGNIEYSLSALSFEGADVRVVSIDGEPAFVGKDVCDRLGYGNPTKAMNDHCRGITKRYPLATNGGIQEVRVLSEADVLRLIVRSKRPEAERFERWVFEEVLPAIRKTGGYMAAAPEETVEQLTLRVMTVLKDTVERQKQQIESMAPKADALDLISASKGDLGVRDAGRELKVGERWVTATILERNWACKQGGKLRPAHYGLTMGYVRLCARIYHDRNTGETCVADDFKITRKGVGRLGELIVAKRLSNVEAV